MQGFQLKKHKGDAQSRLERIAAETARPLLLDTERWIHRRVERLTYTDSELLKWHFSVDFTINESFIPFKTHKDKPNEYYVPIALLRKWPPLMDLDIRDEHGRPIPLLTSAKNRAVDAAALSGLVSTKSNSALKETLQVIASSTSVAEAEAGVTLLSSRVRALLPNMQRSEAEDWLRIVMLATNFASNSILWARVAATPGQRQIVKVGFEQKIPPVAPFHRRILTTLGLTGEWLRLDLHNLGERGSYHLEFAPPPGTDVLEVRLLVRHPLSKSEPLKWFELKKKHQRRKKRQAKLASYYGTATKRRFGRSANRVEEASSIPPLETAYSRNLVSRAHLYVAESSGQKGRAHIRIGPTRREFVTGALYASGLTTALLWFSYFFAENLVEEHHEAPTVTALLLLPALLSYLFTQPLPHPIARRMIAGVRTATRIVTLLPVIAALVMLGMTAVSDTGGPDVGLIESWWFGLAIIATTLTVMLGVTAKLLPRSAVGDLYAPFNDATSATGSSRHPWPSRPR